MAKRRLERVPELTEWQVRLLLGQSIDDLDEVARFDALLDGSADQLLPVWQQHRGQLLDAWHELRGPRRVHPMDLHPPRLPEPRR